MTESIDDLRVFEPVVRKQGGLLIGPYECGFYSSPTGRTMKLGSVAYQMLGRPPRVRLSVNYDDGWLLIKAAPATDNDAYVVREHAHGASFRCEIPARLLNPEQRVYSLMLNELYDEPGLLVKVREQDQMRRIDTNRNE